MPVQPLIEARERTLAMVAPYSDHDLERVTSPILSPLVWDLAHIAAYEDLWLCHRHGGLDLLRPELAEMYDAFETPRSERGGLPLLDRAGALAYLDGVRARSLEALKRVGAGDGVLVELVLRHEQQHGETMLQAIELGGFQTAPGLPPGVRPELDDGPGGQAFTGLERVAVAGGPCCIGAPERGFAYDNERPRHQTDVRDFCIGHVPITNATYLHFVEGGGYERREWWTAEAWHWKEEYDISNPDGWTRGPGGGWLQRRVDGLRHLDPHEPVVHVSWFEAAAFARAHGARLPTEIEWEKAATWDQTTGRALPFPWGEEPPRPGDERANLDHSCRGPSPAGSLPAGAAPCGALGMLGDAWEWTASSFGGYAGFRAHPYREYSEPFFDQRHYVLRGGSWASRAHAVTPTFRNWDLPQRRQIFAGVRLAWST